ncbi:hypothetical protein DV737_g2416, partial [Chaetothyriales sp. CBS 132003]
MAAIAARRGAARLLGSQLRGVALQSQREDAQYRRSMQLSLRRDWQTGDVYAPHDLSAAEMRKWGKKKQPTRDVFDILSVNPLSLYKNFSVMSDFVSEMGRIRPGRETGLRPVNQRKIAKAVRRAIALGLMPSVHKHPEILKRKRGGRF